MEEQESDKAAKDENDVQIPLCNDDETSKIENQSDVMNNISDSQVDSTQASDSKGNGKKGKKSKKNWNNRFSKQKQKGSTSQDTLQENNLNRRPFHLNYKFAGRAGRKRSQSFAAGSKFFLPYKRPRKETFIPPTKFLLGGNISDPLNLNSLQDEDINRAMNAITPKSSPLPTPPRHKAKIEVIYPPDIRDPLNLLNPLDNAEYEKQLETTNTKKPRSRRKRGKTKRRSQDGANNVPVENLTKGSPVKTEESTPMEIPPVEAPRASTPEPSTSTCLPKDLKLDLSHIRGHKRTVSESEGSSKGKDGKKPRRMDFLDKIVSPVVPQPGAWMRVHPRGGGAGRGGSRGGPRTSLSRANSTTNDKTNPGSAALPKFRLQDARYQYGNYDRYYGYRNLDAMIDIRLKVFGLNRHLFNHKDVLDIGCNVGHISIAVAKDLGAKSVTGIDIDKNLIARARKNVKEYVLVPPPGNTPPKEEHRELVANENAPQVEGAFDNTHEEEENKYKLDSSAENPEGVAAEVEDVTMKEASASDLNTKANSQSLSHRQRNKFKRNRRAHHKHAELPKCHFPISCPILYGPAEVAGYPMEGQPTTFPQNIVFKQANYILKDESLLLAEPSQYDLILCLSVTKWFHLNWGDAGLKMAFKRMFTQLRPGGKLILEAQNWASYKKKKKLTETIYKNFMGIDFFPNKFRDYLLSPEVGFSKCCVLGVPQHLSKGFRRPIHLFIKGDFTPSKVQWSDTYAPSSHHQTDLNIENQPKKVYVNAFSPSYNPSTNFWGGTPLYGAATPFSPRLESTTVEESPFYNPRSDSYLPSYTSSGQTKTVYASLSSPQSDYGGTPVHVSEPASNTPSQGVYATLRSPASPFLEPSPGNSGTPSHPFTPSHSASCDGLTSKKVYASLHSPHEEGGSSGRSLAPHPPTTSPAPAPDLCNVDSSSSHKSPKEPNNDTD